VRGTSAAQAAWGEAEHAWSASDSEAACHERLLEGVSRTFGLTIPQLPEGLRGTVTNAYLLCRIADTIEDDPGLHPRAKDVYHSMFVATAESGQGADDFAAALWPKLAPGTPAAEVELIRASAQVLRMTHRLGGAERAAILKCLGTMSLGMRQFERRRSRDGLADVSEYERYCYVVAGVVGEMLTELFCAHSPEIEARRARLETRSVSFGLGLQMTNILKDVREDYENGVCWLPREVFEGNGYDLRRLGPNHNGDAGAFAASMRQLVSIALGHLSEAVDYILAIPSHESGIRRFLSWAVLLALSTLRKIDADPLFSSGAEVKISRRRVAAIVATSNAVIGSNMGLGTLLRTAARGLPLSGGGGWAEASKKESATL